MSTNIEDHSPDPRFSSVENRKSTGRQDGKPPKGAAVNGVLMNEILLEKPS